MIQEMRKRIKWGRAGKKRMLTVEAVSTLVRMTGLEPTQYCYH